MKLDMSFVLLVVNDHAPGNMQDRVKEYHFDSEDKAILSIYKFLGFHFL